jgi:hypothetical protein
VISRSRTGEGLKGGVIAGAGGGSERAWRTGARDQRLGLQGGRVQGGVADEGTTWWLSRQSGGRSDVDVPLPAAKGRMKERRRFISGPPIV